MSNSFEIFSEPFPSSESPIHIGNSGREKDLEPEADRKWVIGVVLNNFIHSQDFDAATTFSVKGIKQKHTKDELEVLLRNQLENCLKHVQPHTINIFKTNVELALTDPHAIDKVQQFRGRYGRHEEFELLARTLDAIHAAPKKQISENTPREEKVAFEIPDDILIQVDNIFTTQPTKPFTYKNVTSSNQERKKNILIELIRKSFDFASSDDAKVLLHTKIMEALNQIKNSEVSIDFHSDFHAMYTQGEFEIYVPVVELHAFLQDMFLDRKSALTELKDLKNDFDHKYFTPDGEAAISEFMSYLSQLNPTDLKKFGLNINSQTDLQVTFHKLLLEYHSANKITATRYAPELIKLLNDDKNTLREKSYTLDADPQLNRLIQFVDKVYEEKRLKESILRRMCNNLNKIQGFTDTAAYLALIGVFTAKKNPSSSFSRVEKCLNQCIQKPYNETNYTSLLLSLVALGADVETRDKFIAQLRIALQKNKNLPTSPQHQPKPPQTSYTPRVVSHTG